MEVDDDTPQPIESTQQSAGAKASPSPSKAKSIAPPQPPAQSEPSPPVKESLPPIVISSPDEAIVAVAKPAIISAAAAADTTTAAIVIDSEAESQSQTERGEPIELVSSPSSDVDAKEGEAEQQQTQKVTNNSQTIRSSQSDAIVDLDTSSNEGDDIKEVIDSSSSAVLSQRPQQTQELESLDLELINSDSSSHSENEVQIAEIPPSPPLTQNVQDAPIQPTSTVQSDVVEIIDANESPANAASDDNANETNNSVVCANESSENLVESTNQQKPIEIPENICTITGKW